MKTKSNRALQGAIFALGIASLLLGVLQLTTNLIQIQFDVHRLPAFLTSDAMYAALLLVPEILLFVYIVLRLYYEMQSAWRTALAAVAYLAIGLVCAYLILTFYNSHYGFVFVMIAAPIGLIVIGLIRKIPGKTLIVFMIANFLYVTSPCIQYLHTKNVIHQAVVASLFLRFARDAASGGGSADPVSLAGKDGCLNEKRVES